MCDQRSASQLPQSRQPSASAVDPIGNVFYRAIATRNFTHIMRRQTLGFVAFLCFGNGLLS